MNHPLVSVILPIFNVVSYIEKCLHTLKEQTLADFEVLMVDDGSTDGSEDICRRFAGEDSRFIHLRKANGGVSDARNYGVSHASGEYISFVDPDDYVTADYLERLYGLLCRSGAGIAACNHMVCRSGRLTPNAPADGDELFFDLHEIFRRVLYHDRVDVSVWGKLYRRSVFEQVTFPVGRIFEDTAAFADIACGGETMAFCPTPLYYYQIREKSITTTAFDSRKLQYIDAADELCRRAGELFPDLERGCVRRRVHARISTLRFMKGKSECAEVRREIITFIRRHAGTLLRDPDTPAADKLAAASLFAGEWAFHLAWSVYCRLTGRTV